MLGIIKYHIGLLPKRLKILLEKGKIAMERCPLCEGNMKREVKKVLFRDKYIDTNVFVCQNSECKEELIDEETSIDIDIKLKGF
jgi:hypothetical protein